MTQVKHLRPTLPLPNSFEEIETRGEFIVAKDGFTQKVRRIIPKEPEMLVREGRTWREG